MKQKYEQQRGGGGESRDRSHFSRGSQYRSGLEMRTGCYGDSRGKAPQRPPGVPAGPVEREREESGRESRSSEDALLPQPSFLLIICSWRRRLGWGSSVFAKGGLVTAANLQPILSSCLLLAQIKTNNACFLILSFLSLRSRPQVPGIMLIRADQ